MPRRVGEADHAGDQRAEGEGPLGEHVDDCGEMFAAGVAGTEAVEFLWDVEPGFVSDRLAGVAEVDDHFDRGAEGLGQADGFPDDVGWEGAGGSRITL